MIDDIIRNTRIDPTMIRRFLITQTKSTADDHCSSTARAGIFIANDTAAAVDCALHKL
jgi:hypothetical protein